MKGIVFNLLEAFVCEYWGESAYEQVLSRCSLSTKEPFVGPGTYPDSDLSMLATEVARSAGMELPDALRAFGRFCFPHLAAQVPAMVAVHRDARSFLKSVDRVIHVEVKKLFPQAVTPSFTFSEPDAERLILQYRSQRKLCALLEGLLEGTGIHFLTKITYEHDVCMHRGAEYCQLTLRFASPSEQP